MTKNPPLTYTANEIAAKLGVKRETIAAKLRGIAADGIRVVRGNNTRTWSAETLPAVLRARLVEYQLPIALADIDDGDIARATKLREALLPFVLRRNDTSISVAEFEAQGIREYARVFSHTITARRWRSLFKRTIQRDYGREEFQRVELYLSEKPKRKTAAPLPACELEEEIPGVRAIIDAAQNPAQLNRSDRFGIWGAAIAHYKSFLNAGMTGKRAARRIRDLLLSQVPRFTPSRDAMLKAFQRALADDETHGRRVDLRKKNGNVFAPPQSDIDLLRDSAAHKNGGRFDSAWREEYAGLSDYTRQRYPLSWNMPQPMVRLVNRELTTSIQALNQGKPALNIIMGGVRRKNDIPSMHRWVVDDLTATLESVLQTADGVSLILPQIIAVMDSGSRMFTGWAISPEKAPTAELACEAVLNGFERYGVPRNLWVENGFVFGRSLNVNGKVDEQGRTIVAGLGSYGCVVRHFEKRNPQSKGELEKGFDLFQRLFERHPGYTGRIQMFDASDTFKREQRMIRAGKIEGTAKRYTYEELSQIVLPKLFAEFNATPRQSLNGLSPVQEFERRSDPNHQPITFTPELRWLLANERYLVKVKAGGVTIRHFGRKLRVRGEQLANFIGKELRAVVSRRDESMVTFMSKDFSNPFTMEVCKEPSIDEAAMEPGSGVLASERKKIGEHVQVIRDERNRLADKFGDHRAQLLDGIRHDPEQIYVRTGLAQSGAEMEQQRADIRAERELQAKERQRTNRIASVAGVHPAAVADPEALKRIAEIIKSND